MTDDYEPIFDTYDLAEFEPYLEDIHIPEERKQEFLETLWSIMVQFVALGFGADAASQAIAAHLLDKPDGDTPKKTQALCDTFAASAPAAPQYEEGGLHD